jgi:limonene-1,2-epoxide hydrolase
VYDRGMSTPTERNAAAARRVCDAWPSLTLDDWRAPFAAKAVYRNIPMPGDTIGPEAIHAFLRGALGVYEVKCDTLSVVADERRVAVERLEHFSQRDGQRTFDLPVLGVFEFENGLITAWRDYFDLKTFTG